MTPEPLDAYWARVLAARNAEGGFSVPEFASWDAFCYSPESLATKAFGDPSGEKPRRGDDPAECYCATPPEPGQGPTRLWHDEHFKLTLIYPEGAPLAVMLTPLEHYDLPDLPQHLAERFGVLMTHLMTAIEALPSVGRCHMFRWGDGTAHGHAWFIGRPGGHPQVRGTFATLWCDHFPPTPRDIALDNARAVVDMLVERSGGDCLI